MVFGHSMFVSHLQRVTFLIGGGDAEIFPGQSCSIPHQVPVWVGKTGCIGGLGKLSLSPAFGFQTLSCHSECCFRRNFIFSQCISTKLLLILTLLLSLFLLFLCHFPVFNNLGTGTTTFNLHILNFFAFLLR